MKRILFIIFLCSNLAGYSQVKGVFGYNFGMHTPAQRYFQIYEYQFNEYLGDSVKQLRIPNYLRGAHVGIRFGDEGGYFEMGISNKKLKSNTIEYWGNDNQLYRYQLKNRLRTFNIGFALGSENVKLGASLDVGGFKMFQKNSYAETYGDAEWEKVRGTLYTGYTIFTSFQFLFLEARPYFQSSFFLDDLEGVTLRAMNIGVNINLIIGEM